jgi:hypothetical protein
MIPTITIGTEINVTGNASEDKPIRLKTTTIMTMINTEMPRNPNDGVRG